MTKAFENAPFAPLEKTRSYMALQAAKRKNRNEWLAFLALAVVMLSLPLVCYCMVTNELCNRIESGVYDTQTQNTMKLSPEICAKPWYAKL